MALSFDYGQRHRVELRAASAVAASLGIVDHRVALIDLRAFGGSALTADIPVPKDRIDERGTGVASTVHSAHASDPAVPITYVPARNTIFLAHALALAEVSGARHLGIGVNAVDYSGYPDCRPAFVAAFERLANLATREGVEATERGASWLHIHAPLLERSKGDIVRRGMELGVDFAQTFSCYDPTRAVAVPATGATRSTMQFGCVPCGHCDACVLRARGFAEAGMADPLLQPAH